MILRGADGSQRAVVLVIRCDGSEVPRVSEETAYAQLDIDGGVVVGADRSVSSVPALLAAAEEVRLRGEELHVVHAWSIRTAPRPEGCPPGVVPSLDEYQRAVREDVRRLVANHLGERPGFPVRVHAVHSAPARALLNASRGAGLLVVGYPGRRGFAGLVMGVITEQCVRYAHCPVLVARHPAD